jgi:hypothetical protein
MSRIAPLSNYGSNPTEITKSDVPRLNADTLRKLEGEIHLHGEPDIRPDFDFPCKDDSRGVEDFRDWKYFKRPQFHTPPVNMKHSFLWCPELLSKIRDQRNYKQFIPEKTLTGYRETNQNLARKKRAKRMLAIWKKSPSTIRLMDGSEAAATAAGTGTGTGTGAKDQAGTGKQARGGSKRVGGGRSISPPKRPPQQAAPAAAAATAPAKRQQSPSKGH